MLSFTPRVASVFFNVDHGYLEGLVRGFKCGILTASDYVNLAQCETLEETHVVRSTTHIKKGTLMH
uniref:Uncharacterized protein n=1 Tax=Podarcis muralis TaxID=64176 RepID=A0A670IF77_PODMU